MIMNLDIGAIQTDIQPRGITYKETIDEYAEAMRNGAQFPPIKVVGNGCDYWLVDGHHRLNAMKQNGMLAVTADVICGEHKDARSMALEANHVFGMKRTNEEKRCYVLDAWKWREDWCGANPSNHAIAKKVGVSETFVRNLFEQGVITRPANAPRMGADGKSYYNSGAHGAQVRSNPPPPPPPPPQNVNYNFGTTPPPPPTMPASIPPPPPNASPYIRFDPSTGKWFDPTDFNPVELDQEPVRETVTREPVLDRFGVEIQPDILATYQGADEIGKELEAQAQAIKRTINKLAGEGDPRLGALVIQATLVDSQNLINAFRAMRPYCACRKCRGYAGVRDTCGACNERGWQTKRQYQCNPPEWKDPAEP